MLRVNTATTYQYYIVYLFKMRGIQEAIYSFGKDNRCSIDPLISIDINFVFIWIYQSLSLQKICYWPIKIVAQ